jgi:hypothetical protein
MIQMTKLETGQICKMILICNELWKKNYKIIKFIYQVGKYNIINYGHDFPCNQKNTNLCFSIKHLKLMLGKRI